MGECERSLGGAVACLGKEHIVLLPDLGENIVDDGHFTLGVADAEGIVKVCVDPAIKRQVEGLEWDPESLEWTSAQPS